MSERQIHLSSYMTETEALMWAAESDPWFSSGMGSLFLLDDAPDFERFLASMLDASLTLTRLRERVEASFGLAPPRWVIDDEFDITDHVRHVQLPKPGGIDQLLELTAQVFQDPFDTSRPLWEFVAVAGPGGRKTKTSISGAIIMKLHHSVSDGIGALRLAEMYLDFERNPQVEIDSTSTIVPVNDPDTTRGVRADIEHVAKRQVALARKAAAEVSLWGADSERVKDVVSKTGDMAKAAAGQLRSGGPQTGSSEWRNRSRQRHLEVFDVSLDELKAASKRLGGSVNDAFVAGSVLGAQRYHEAVGVQVPQFNLSFVVSTRSDDAAGGNAFTPVPFHVRGDYGSVEEVFVATRDAIADKLEEVQASSPDALNVMAGVASLLPGSVLSKAGRARAQSLDWATSNLRGAPIPIFTAGAQITHMYPIGPVAGTAFNLTAMSYCGNLHVGCFLDPKSVTRPGLLRSSMQQAYADICATDVFGV